jgi:hypothetical protein
METRNNSLAIAFARILGIAVLCNALNEQTPSCIIAMPTKAATVSTCPVKQPGTLHLDREDLAADFGVASTAMPPGMQLLDLPPSVKHYQPDDLFPNLVLAMAPCPDKEQTPLHLERKDAFALSLPSAVQLVSAMPQFYEDIQPKIFPPAQQGELA